MLFNAVSLGLSQGMGVSSSFVRQVSGSVPSKLFCMMNSVPSSPSKLGPSCQGLDRSSFFVMQVRGSAPCKLFCTVKLT